MPFYTVRTPSNFYQGTAFNGGRNLARTSTGVLWCCYSSPDAVTGHEQIYVSWSADNGVTWIEEQITAHATRDQRYPSIAIDSLDNIHLTWCDTRLLLSLTGDIMYRRRTAIGWDAPEAITAVTFQYPAYIAIDSVDNINLVWCGHNWGLNPADTNVQFRQKIGAVWQPQEAITDIAFDALWNSPSIAINATDVISIVWSQKGWGANPGDYNIQYRERIAGVWQPQEAITDLATWNHMPCIAVDSADSPKVIWYAEYAPGIGAIWELFFTERLAGVWSVPLRLTFMAPFDQYQPSISIDSSDDIHVVWYGGGYGVNPVNYNLQHLKRTAGVWGAREPLSDRAFDQYLPSLIWAMHPTVAGVKPNIVDDYLFVFTGQQIPGALDIEFFNPIVSIPFRINKAYALAREEL